MLLEAMLNSVFPVFLITLLFVYHAKSQDTHAVRLVDGTSPNNGRVEIYYGISWQTVCDEGWDHYNANVVCTQLGYGSIGARPVLNSYYGSPSGASLQVSCNSWDTQLDNCYIYSGPFCSSSNTAGVQCGDPYVTTTFAPDSDYGAIRLVGGSSPSNGRVEINYYGLWGTICGDSWDNSDAQVVCRQLGYPSSGAEAVGDARYGQGSGPIFLDDVSCLGYESQLTSCSNNGWYVNNCDHSKDAGVRCYGSRSVTRLVGGSSADEGRVEVFRNGQWGTICDFIWDNKAAQVVCRELGYSTEGALARSKDYFGRGSGPTLIQYVSCDGGESRLEDCNYGNQHSCFPGEDAGVVCSPATAPIVTGMMSFVGIACFLLIIIAAVAVCHTCKNAKQSVASSQGTPLTSIGATPANNVYTSPAVAPCQPTTGFQGTSPNINSSMPPPYAPGAQGGNPPPGAAQGSAPYPGAAQTTPAGLECNGEPSSQPAQLNADQEYLEVDVTPGPTEASYQELGPSMAENNYQPLNM